MNETKGSIFETLPEKPEPPSLTRADVPKLEQSGTTKIKNCPLNGAICKKEGCQLYVSDAGDLSDCAFVFIAKALECIAGRV